MVAVWEGKLVEESVFVRQVGEVGNFRFRDGLREESGEN